MSSLLLHFWGREGGAIFFALNGRGLSAVSWLLTGFNVYEIVGKEAVDRDSALGIRWRWVGAFSSPGVSVLFIVSALVVFLGGRERTAPVRLLEMFLVSAGFFGQIILAALVSGTRLSTVISATMRLYLA